MIDFNTLITNKDLDYHLAFINQQPETPRHTHLNFCEILVVISGNVIHQCNNQNTLITPGGILLIPARTEHYMRFEKNTPKMLAVNLAIREEFAETLTQLMLRSTEILTPQAPLLKQLSGTEVHDIFQSLTALACAVANQNILLTQIWGEVLRVLKRNSSELIADDQAIPLWLQQAVAHLRNPTHPVKELDGFFRLCGYSQAHVSRMIQKHYHMTTRELVNEVKLQEFARRLLVSEDTVDRIAWECHFVNIGYAYELFKRYFHCTPNQYRNRHRWQ